jgi:hypothetical protein
VALLTITRNQILAIPLEGDPSTGNLTIQLPSVVKLVTASHQQVCIITVSNEIFFWKIGGNLRQFQYSPLPVDIEASLDRLISREHHIYFHPHDESRFYFVTILICGPELPDILNPVQVILQEYENDAITRTNRFKLGINVQKSIKSLELEDGNIGFRILGSRSALVSDIDLKSGTITHPEGIVDPSHCPGCGNYLPIHLQTILKLDIHSRRWSISTYHISNDLLMSPDRSLLWRDQLLFEGKPLRTDHEYAPSAVIQMNESCELQRTSREPWLERPYGANANDVLNRPHGTYGNDEKWQFDGDDDFIVGFGRKDYMVWRFDTVDPLPPQMPEGRNGSMSIKSIFG